METAGGGREEKLMWGLQTVESEEGEEGAVKAEGAVCGGLTGTAGPRTPGASRDPTRKGPVLSLVPEARFWASPREWETVGCGVGVGRASSAGKEFGTPGDGQEMGK